jgi:hypothetical protein
VGGIRPARLDARRRPPFSARLRWLVGLRITTLIPGRASHRWRRLRRRAGALPKHRRAPPV